MKFFIHPGMKYLFGSVLLPPEVSVLLSIRCKTLIVAIYHYYSVLIRYSLQLEESYIN